MCRLRNLILASSLFVVVVMGVVASSASALSVTTEPGGVACSAVTYVNHGVGAGGCLIRITGAGIEEGSPLGMIVCNNAFEARVGGNGEGFIYNQTLTNCSPVVAVPCVEPSGGPEAGVTRNWKVEMATQGPPPASPVPSEVNLELQRCTSFAGITSSCHLNITLTESPTHRYTFSTGGVHRACESPDNATSFQGTWPQTIDAAHPAIEIVD